MRVWMTHEEPTVVPEPNAVCMDCGCGYHRTKCAGSKGRCDICTQAARENKLSEYRKAAFESELAKAQRKLRLKLKQRPATGRKTA